ncbi:hypothetical protein ATANTOWER_007527 [Ataeniobius toweri]|uniref:Uncharacterized protein n=1 Tax=Ataeniobius toweri TaxID=208326 RepID=A0ABU7AIS1_9TELE|nr:hypothetical protein [Ataeniobius toweri]
MWRRDAILFQRQTGGNGLETVLQQELLHTHKSKNITDVLKDTPELTQPLTDWFWVLMIKPVSPAVESRQPAEGSGRKKLQNGECELNATKTILSSLSHLIK